MNDFTVIKQAKLSPYAIPNCHISSTPEEMLKLFTDGLPIVTEVSGWDDYTKLYYGGKVIGATNGNYFYKDGYFYGDIFLFNKVIPENFQKEWVNAEFDYVLDKNKEIQVSRWVAFYYD